MTNKKIIWYNPIPRQKPFHIKKSVGISTTIHRLVKKIYEDTGIICDPTTFRRTYAKNPALQAGALSGTMRIQNSTINIIGSQWPASECIKKKYKLEAGQHNFCEILIFPEKI